MILHNDCVCSVAHNRKLTDVVGFDLIKDLNKTFLALDSMLTKYYKQQAERHKA